MLERLTDRVAVQARRHANDRAIVDVRPMGVLVWTWRKLWRESERVAVLLAQLGVEAGGVVAYQVPNRAEFPVITLGALTAMHRFLGLQQVSRSYWPERSELIEALPKGTSGMIQRYLLRERARGLISGDARKVMV
jgi:acyl-CoA synthetase (AMP-forming)/AMP-acid ligase II